MYAPALPGSMTCWCSLHPCSIPRRNLPHRLGIVDVPFPHSSISSLLFGAPVPV